MIGGGRAGLAAGYYLRRQDLDLVILDVGGNFIDQFLQDNANHRTDEYGGTVANRARLLLEVLAALSETVGADRVGVRLSPSSTFQDMADSDPIALFTYVFQALSTRKPRLPAHRRTGYRRLRDLPAPRRRHRQRLGPPPLHGADHRRRKLHP